MQVVVGARDAEADVYSGEVRGAMCSCSVGRRTFARVNRLRLSSCDPTASSEVPRPRASRLCPRVPPNLTKLWDAF